MSIGYCGRMELFTEDNDAAIYRYCGENWNDHGETRGNIETPDGEILIKKKCLADQTFDLAEALRNGDIEILKPCASEYSHGLHLGIDRMYFAMKLLWILFTEYQEQGILPEKVSFIV
ncbi:MAG: hypothetical protein ACI4ML_13110 [Aristaeellaceae bacterium]